MEFDVNVTYKRMKYVVCLMLITSSVAAQGFQDIPLHFRSWPKLALKWRKPASSGVQALDSGLENIFWACNHVYID